MASSGSVGTLSWSAKLDSNEFKKGVKKVKKQMKEAQINVAKSVKIMAKGFTLATGAIAGVTTALGAMTAQSAKAVKEIQDLARVADTTFSDFVKMSEGAKKFGIEQDKLSDILKDVKDRVGDFIATGGGPMADFFENIAPKIGITADAFKDLSGKDSLQLFYKSLEQANLSQAEMTFYLEAMASDLTMLQPLLENNSALFKQFGDEAERMGLVLSDDKVNKMTDAWGKFETTLQLVRGLTRQLSAELSTSLGNTFSFISSAIETFRDNLIIMFGDLNNGYQIFLNNFIEGFNDYAIPAFVAFQNAVVQVGQAMATLFNFVANSPIGTTIDNWTLSLVDFLSTLRESLAFGVFKAFKTFFSFVNKQISNTLWGLNKVNSFFQKIAVKLGAKSEFDAMWSEAVDEGRLKAFDNSLQEIEEEFKDIEKFLQGDLNKALGERLEQVEKMQKKFNASVSDFKKIGNYDSKDGKNGRDADPIKVEVDASSVNNILATAGSIEEFNLMSAQQKEEINIAKAQLKQLQKLNKNQPKEAGL